MPIDLDFDWYRKFSKDGSPAYKFAAGFIHEVGRVKDTISRPLDHKLLFQDLADLDGSPSSCVNFASRWGLLTLQEWDSERVEPISLWRQEIKSMRFWVAGLRESTKWPLPGTGLSNFGADTRLYLKNTGPAFSLVLRPRALIDAMRIQMAQFFCAGKRLASCVECGQSFEIGAERRADAKYCSDTCRFRHHNKRRAGK